MDWEYDYWTIEAMRKFGGSFVKTLAELASRADRQNLQKIKNAWPEYWEDYQEKGQTLRFEACPEGMCDGSGEIPADEDDGEGHTMRGVGTQKCLCKAKNDE